MMMMSGGHSLQPTAVRSATIFHHIGPPFLLVNALNAIVALGTLAKIRIFREVADALAHMNDKGFVHADMKPTNVLVTEDGSVKVIDLGQAHPIGKAKERIQGTPGYIAPEQAEQDYGYKG